MASTQVIGVRIALVGEVVEPHLRLAVLVGQCDRRPLGAACPRTVPRHGRNGRTPARRGSRIRTVDTSNRDQCPVALACSHGQAAATAAATAAWPRPGGWAAASARQPGGRRRRYPPTRSSEHVATLAALGHRGRAARHDLRAEPAPRRQRQRADLHRVPRQGRGRRGPVGRGQPHEREDLGRAHRRHEVLHQRWHRSRPVRSRRGAARGAGRHGRVQVAELQLAAQRPRPDAPGHLDHRVLRVDAAARRRPDGQRDVDRSQPRQGVQHRQAVDDVRRHRRLRGRQAGDHRGRRLPADARALP